MSHRHILREDSGDKAACVFRTFQCRHPAKLSNQSLIGSLRHIEERGNFEVRIVSMSPLSSLHRLRPSNEAHATPRASGDTITYALTNNYLTLIVRHVFNKFFSITPILHSVFPTQKWRGGTINCLAGRCGFQLGLTGRGLRSCWHISRR